jgi:hypothetical protein
MTPQIGRYRRNPLGRSRLCFMLRHSSSTGLCSLVKKKQGRLLLIPCLEHNRKRRGSRRFF